VLDNVRAGCYHKTIEFNISLGVPNSILKSMQAEKKIPYEPVTVMRAQGSGSTDLSDDSCITAGVFFIGKRSRKQECFMNWFEQAFGGFLEISPVAFWIIIAAIAVGITGIIIYRRKSVKKSDKLTKSQWTVRELTTASLCIAAAFLLSFIKIFSMPMGGSITPASMLPIMAFAYIYGTKKGLIVGLCYSILQFVQEPFFLTPVQFLLDYTGAFTLLALAGLAKKNIIPGILYGCAARFLCQFTSGVVFFGEYAPEGMPTWLYSLGYSGSIVGVECAICVGVSLIPSLYKMFNRAKAKVQAARQPRNVRQHETSA
jgi:thiamine transporter